MAAQTLSNYTDLISAISGTAASWLHRQDVADVAPIWIQMAEATMNYGDNEVLQISALKTGSQEVIATVVTVAGQQTVTLPSGCLEMRKIYYNYGGVRVELVGAPASPMRLAERSNVLAPPSTYMVEGNTLYLVPIPDAAYTITVDYYSAIGPISASSPTNWLLTASPMCYLAGAIVHGSPWLGNKYDPTMWIGAFKGAMAGVKRADIALRYRNTKMRSEAAQFQNRPFNIVTGELI